MTEEFHSHLVSLLAEAARVGKVPASGAQMAHCDSSGATARLLQSEVGVLPAQAWRGRLDWQDRARPQDWDVEQEPDHIGGLRDTAVSLAKLPAGSALASSLARRFLIC